jgi:hypothetical protein
MRVGYFGPEGTFTHEALLAATATGREPVEPVALPTIYDAVMAVHDGTVQRVLVPIENSLEGSVNATLDALAMETEDVAILGEVVHPIRHCLIARTPLELSDIEVVLSHPQASAQCARFIRNRLPQARVLAGGSVGDGRGAALGSAWQPGGGDSLRRGCAACRGRGRGRQRDPVRVAWAGRGAAAVGGGWCWCPRRGGCCGRRGCWCRRRARWYWRGGRFPAGTVEDRDRLLGCGL